MENETNIVQDVLVCACSSAEHQVILNYFKDDTDPFVYVHIHLATLPFWDRVKNALKYIVGYKCRYGAFEEIVLGPEHVSKLLSIVNHIKEIEVKNAITA